MTYIQRVAEAAGPDGQSQERRFPAMGSEAHVVVVGWQAEELLHLAEWRVSGLEARWSRFLEDSELSRVNARAGEWVPVSGDTLRLVDRSLAAWRMTDGAFDPTVLAGRAVRRLRPVV